LAAAKCNFAAKSANKFGIAQSIPSWKSGAVMRIRDVAYLSREIGSAVVFSNEYFSDLSKALEDDAKSATQISIVSGYFGSDYVLNILQHITKRRRVRCTVRLIFGCENTWDFVYKKSRERELLDEVIKLGFRKKRVKIKVFRDTVPLHTKLYGFLKTTSPVWFVGSANASKAIDGARHELMMRVTGRSEALEKYVSELLETTSDALDKKSSLPILLKSYFAEGSLIFKPTRYRRFTYDAFAINTSERRTISDQLGKDSRVPHADPGAEGFGFNLLSALGADAVSHEKKAESLHFRKYCVETAFGYWAPCTSIDRIETALKRSQVNDIEKLRLIAAALNKATEEDLQASFQSYLDSAQKFFDRVGVKPKRNPNDAAFLNFINIRREWLNNEDWISRTASKIVISPMPIIWSDERASQLFEDSFIDDIVAALNAPGNIAKVYREIAKQFMIPNSPDRATVEKALKPQHG